MSNLYLENRLVSGSKIFKDSVEKICNLEESSPVPLDGFIDWAKTEGNNEKKSRFKNFQMHGSSSAKFG